MTLASGHLLLSWINSRFDRFPADSCPTSAMPDFRGSGRRQQRCREDFWYESQAAYRPPTSGRGPEADIADADRKVRDGPQAEDDWRNLRCYNKQVITLQYTHVLEVIVVHDLIAAAEKVDDERAFIQLLQTMALDWEDQREKELVNPSSPYSAGANGWESGSIGQFLESAAAWAEDTLPTADSRPDVSDVWRRAAMIVVAGAFYE